MKPDALAELEFMLIDPELPPNVPLAKIPVLLGRMEELRVRLQAVLFTLRQCGGQHEQREEDGWLITVKEAADRLKLTRQYLYGLLKAGDISPVKCGKYVRIRVSDLNLWIEKHIEKPLDNQLYRRYSKRHERKATGTDSKVARPYSSANGGENRRRVEHRGALGEGRVADIRARLQADTANRSDREKPETEA